MIIDNDNSQPSENNIKDSGKSKDKKDFNHNKNVQMNKFKKIYSFDLVSRKPFITECDIRKLPLINESVDVAIFCLALMGLNHIEFILEANRCLKKSGYLIIAEVLSRFKNVKEFVRLVKDLGFVFKRYVNINIILL